jgi:hypothetical protein
MDQSPPESLVASWLTVQSGLGWCGLGSKLAYLLIVAVVDLSSRPPGSSLLHTASTACLALSGVWGILPTLDAIPEVFVLLPKYITST